MNVGDKRSSVAPSTPPPALAAASSALPRTLVYVQGNSAKFYAVEVKKNVVRIKFGRIGTQGQVHQIVAASPQAALATAGEKIREKLAEGYVGDTSARSAAPAKSAPAAAAGTYTVTEMSWSKLEQLIEKTYGKQYEIVPSEEWSNDSQHRFDVDGKVDDYERREIESFKEEGSGSYLLRALLNDMATRGVLAKGKYLVTVCW